MAKSFKSPQRDWENPAVFDRNKARSHVPLHSFRKREAALQYFTEGPSAAPTPAVLRLSSTSDWRFKLFDKPEEVPEQFSRPEYDDGDWHQVNAYGHAAAADQSCLLRKSLMQQA